MANMFRLLRADEIDARIGTAKPNGVSLLLYKDARCDQNILDETVGPYNWKREHSRDNANCTVSLWDNEKGQWVSKEDTGTESKTEAEKGLASDSFKRACFNWGIGRELYSAPFIWIQGKGDDLKFEKFTVTEIGYDQNREINRLQIVNKAGNVVYRFGNVSGKAPIMQEQAPADALKPGEKMAPPTAGSWNPRNAVALWCKNKGIKLEDFANMQAALIAGSIVPDIKSSELQPEQFDELIHAMEANYPDMLRKPA